MKKKTKKKLNLIIKEYLDYLKTDFHEEEKQKLEEYYERKKKEKLLSPNK